MLRIDVITIHPAFIEAYAHFGVIKAAANKQLAAISTLDLRRYAVDQHGSIDGAPYGGGDGMVMRPEPLAAAISSLKVKPTVILTSPAGRLWNQAEAQQLLAKSTNLAIVCGRFAGVDQRFIDQYVDYEYSVGDVVLSGGELPALMMIDAMLRLIPGVLGHADSAKQDSFAEGFAGGLEHPLYTRPPVFEGLKVPDVLLSGDHAAITRWRQGTAYERTRRLRPDLLAPK